MHDEFVRTYSGLRKVNTSISPTNNLIILLRTFLYVFRKQVVKLVLAPESRLSQQNASILPQEMNESIK